MSVIQNATSMLIVLLLQCVSLNFSHRLSSAPAFRARLQLLRHPTRAQRFPQWKTFVQPTAPWLRFTSRTSGTVGRTPSPCMNTAQAITVVTVCSRSCSMEEGASDKCRECVERALQHHSDSPEALQLMASYLFSTERNQVSKYTHTHTHTHQSLHAHMHAGWVIATLKRESAELIILSKLNCMPLISWWTRALTLTHTQAGHAGRNVNYLPFHLGHTFIW